MEASWAYTCPLFVCLAGSSRARGKPLLQSWRCTREQDRSARAKGSAHENASEPLCGTRRDWSHMFLWASRSLHTVDISPLGSAVYSASGWVTKNTELFLAHVHASLCVLSFLSWQYQLASSRRCPLREPSLTEGQNGYRGASLTRECV